MSDNLISLLGFLLVFGTALSFAFKIGYHLDYYKVLYPEQLQNVTGFTPSHWKQHPSSVDVGVSIMCFFPFFLDRRIEKEKSNWKLAALAKKIRLSVYLTWLFAGASLIYIIIRFNLVNL